MMGESKSDSSNDAWRAAEQSGEDMGQLAYLLTLTPAERLIRHERARLAVAAFREAGRKFYGFDPAHPPAIQRSGS